MKKGKIYSLFAILLLSTSTITLQAQVTIGSNNAPSSDALLDLKSNLDGTSAKGLLLPRVKLTSTSLSIAGTTTMNPAGMIVYNVNTAGDVTPGYYYSDGAKWVRIADASASGSGSTGTSSGWSLSGNASTNPGTDYIGTTDAKDFVVKTNGAEAMRVTSGGNVGIGTGSDALTSKLEVNGSATNHTSYVAPNTADATTGTIIIDFSNSNLAYTTADATDFTIRGIKDGGTYTLAVQGTNVGTAVFHSENTAIKSYSPNNGDTIQDEHTLYTFLVMGNTVYVFMTVGFLDITP